MSIYYIKRWLVVHYLDIFGKVVIGEKDGENFVFLLFILICYWDDKHWFSHVNSHASQDIHKMSMHFLTNVSRLY